MATRDLYKQYEQILHKIADVKYASAVLQWDQETYMPNGAANIRAQQLATLSEIAHELSTHEPLGAILNTLLDKEDLAPEEKKNVFLSLEEFNKQKKYNAAFVRLMSKTTSKAFQNWVEARKANDFSLFEKDLDQIVALKLEEASMLGYKTHPYDALLNDFDRGASVAQNDVFFEEMKIGLKKILYRIQQEPVVEDSFLKKFFPKDKQWNLGMELLALIGYDFTTGRQDIAAHPFTINFGSTDVRVTTRIAEYDFCNMLFSTIHEGGHALYEQGLLPENYGLPMGEPASFVVHESQSRLWENNICKSLSFWQFYYPRLQNIFPEQLGDVGLQSFYKAINKVAPSLIRTESDEVTYHFHVMIRYEIEKALLNREIKAKDVPSIWRQKYRDYLQVHVDSDADGCLQDVHWSHGSFGYFSTYSMGTAMAAQLHHALLNDKIADKGLNKEEIGKIRVWLRKNLFIFGKYYSTNELCTKISGEQLKVDYLLHYLENKFFGI